jgi:glycosyltransferase involved in cell wall biosynthesis
MLVQFVVNSVEHNKSTARYHDVLLKHLQSMAGLTVTPFLVGQPTLPTALNRVIARAGLDLNAFFKTYPIRWPEAPQGVVHLTNRTLATLMTLRKPPVPIVVTVHDIIHFQYRADPLISTYRHAVHAWADAQAVYALRRADAVLASSEFTRRALIEQVGVAPERVHTIHLGVETARFQPRPIPELFYTRYGLNPNGRYILHVSTEEPRKDMPTLIRALAALRQQHPQANEVKLIKIGRPAYPEMRAELVTLTQALNLHDAVIFIDDIADEDLVTFYNASHLSVLPSLVEGFGFPVLESLACGTPVVCSDGGSLAEIAGEAALVIRPRDVSGLARAMAVLLDEGSAARDQRRDAGRAHAATFTWERVAARTASVYQQVYSAARQAH